MSHTYAVAMSGGVDSSAVAALLLAEKNDVVGLTMDIHENCMEDIENAERVCKVLGIEHHVVNVRKEYKAKVIDVFASYYANGLTPNPCVLCNRDIKFDLLMRAAKANGAEKLATGHYVSMTVDGDVVRMREAKNQKKDQTYFLSLVLRANLKDALFPLGSIQDKEETRKLAQSLGLPNFAQQESQDVCFIPGGNYKTFLKDLYGGMNLFAPGNIKAIETGAIVGQHNGIANYTVGQRRGIGVTSKDPLYVTSIDPKNNEIVVGSAGSLKVANFKAVDVNWIVDMPEQFEAFIKQRSLCTKTPAVICKLDDNTIDVRLIGESATPIASGQICAMYDGDGIVIGGGIIKR
ncbi:MAG: tRNA 2-thiouridine(34) synthase MnmA [Holosporales bacterium]|nr:tRNA 2-thiouridine(34) synthase MnmA [Holosporales bacterium]